MHFRFHLLRRTPSSWYLFRPFILNYHLNLVLVLILNLDLNCLNRLAAGLRLCLELLSFLHLLRVLQKTSNHGGLNLPERHPSWTLKDHPCSFSAH